MNPIQHAMAADHKRCDNLLVQAESLVAKNDREQAQQQLTAFIQAMHRHFQHEENVLFPAFELAGGGSSGPTLMMRHEHEDMRKLMNDMQKALQNNNNDRFLGLTESLMIFMQQHNIKEEQILYPMIDSQCADQAEQLMHEFNTSNNSDAA